jgi:hypothetical protein
MPRLAWTLILLFVLSHVIRMTDMYHCAQLLGKMGSLKLFAWAGLQPHSFWSQSLKYLWLQAWVTVPSKSIYTVR